MCGCFFFFWLPLCCHLVGGRRDGEHLVQIRMWRYKCSLYTLTGGVGGARRSERVAKCVPHQMLYILRQCAILDKPCVYHLCK